VRRVLSILLAVALVPAAVVVPALSASAAAPHPVAPHVTSIAITGTAPRPALVTAEQQTVAFSAFGASWQGAADKGSVQVRVRAVGTGTWSDWTSLGAADGGPDPGSPDAVAAGDRVASEPVWAGPSDAVQTRVLGVAPADLKVELVDPGTSAADATVVPAATTRMPAILTRAQWGADESLRRKQCPGGPTYSSTIKIGFVHHTVSTNDYTAAQVPALIRSIYAYHVNGNGWCDIGYNFLVDRFGRLWEGRFGGMDKAVIGSHTGGFNKDSFAVSMIGDFSSLTPDASMQQSIAELMAWKLGSYYRNPLGTDTLTYAGGDYRFCGAKECPVGSKVRLDVITGHRDADVGHTSCPGDAGEATLPALRTGTVAAMGGGLVLPSITTVSHRVGDGGAFTITAGVVTQQSWTLTATGPDGVILRTVTGSATAGSQIAASWDGLTDTGAPAPPGAYTLTLSSAGPTGPAIPYTVAVTLHAPVELTGPAQVGYGQTETLTGSTYANSAVTLFQAPAGTTSYTPVASVTSDADGAFSWGYVGTVAMTTYAQSGAFVSPTVTAAIGPSISGPAAVLPGSVVTLTGTAPPGSDVQVFLQSGTNPAALLATLTAGPDGSWSTTYTADTTYSWYAVAAGLTSPTGSTSTSAPPTLAGPSSAALHSTVTLTGAAPAGETVQIWRRERGRTAYAISATVTSTPSGTFAWTYPANDDFRWYATTLGGQSAIGLTQVGVTASGPVRVDKGALTTLHGTALPGAGVEVWRAAGGGKAFVEVGAVTARTDGSWTWPFTVVGNLRWYATSRGLQSAPGSTLVASPPLISGPPATTYGATVHITGRATPGDTVTLWLHRRGSTGYQGAASAVAGLDGRWAMTYRADEDYRWYVSSVSGRSKAGTTVIRTLAAAVPVAKLGARVRLHGFAVAAQVVRVYFRASGARRWTLGRTLRANAAGHWGTTFTVTGTVKWYAVSRGLRSATGTTRPR
jgi:N-acetylmuramoyl-L-alanine amidase